MCHAAAENDLLAEEIGLRLLLECRLDDARARAADAACIRKREVKTFARRVLSDREHIRHAAALAERTAYEMAGPLRRNHEHVDILCGNDLVKVDVEPVRKCERAVWFQVRCDLALVERRLLLIRNEDHRNVRSLDRIRYGENLEPVFSGELRRLRARIKPDDNVYPAVLQVQCMRVALAAVADDRNRLALEHAPVDILIIVSFCHSTPAPHNVHKWCVPPARAQ